MAGKIFVGIGGWTFEPWRGVFYPDDLTQKRELGQVARRHARRLRLRGESLAFLHQPPRAVRGGRIGAALRDARAG